MRYLTGADARMRLHNSYCLFDGVPVFVQVGTDSLVASIIELKTGKHFTNVDANDERLDVESLPLGYANSDGRIAGFCSRLPYRQQKQGISSDNTRILWERWRADQRNKDTFGSIDYTAALNMFTNVYTPFDKAKSDVTSTRSESVAFHRKLAVVSAKDQKKINIIRYAGETMGFLLHGKKEALIIPKFSDPVFRILLAKMGVEHEILESSSESDESN